MSCRVLVSLSAVALVLLHPAPGISRGMAPPLTPGPSGGFEVGHQAALLRQVSPYEDLTSVLMEIKGAQADFLKALEGVSDLAVIGAQCDSLGARFETLTPTLSQALEHHPELQTEVPEGLKGTLDDCIQAWMQWDTFMNETVLPLANEHSDAEALQAGFGRLNAAVFYMKYSRKVMPLGRESS